jgi:hypothetical protein
MYSLFSLCVWFHFQSSVLVFIFSVEGGRGWKGGLRVVGAGGGESVDCAEAFLFLKFWDKKRAHIRTETQQKGLGFF